MFQRTTVLGISMTPRHNRRVFVTLAYALLLLVMASLSMLDPFRHETIIWFYLAVMIVSHWVFGRLVRPMFPLDTGPKQDAVHVSPYVDRSRPEEDERETAVRSDSYVFAYRAIAIYSVMLLMLFPVLIEREINSLATYRTITLQFLVMLLFAIVFTLPQATILWKQDDLFSEASG